MKNLIFRIIAICMVTVLLFSLCGCFDKEVTKKQKKEIITNLVKNPKLAESSYKLGDNMGDYTITDINGKTHTFSEILKEKKAIVLNFWFINCGPCQMEFPYLQAAANKYSDDIDVIAINPIDTRDDRIKKYATDNELTIPLVKGEDAWNNALLLRGYPTTVVIDRYGSIAFIHMGAITEEGLFEKIFEFFADDDYKQTTIADISEIQEKD